MRLCASQGGRASDAGRQKRDYVGSCMIALVILILSLY